MPERDAAIRLATLADAEAIAHVHVRTWQTAYRGLVPDDYLDGLSVEQRSEVWRGMLADPQPNEPVWVAERRGQVTAFAGAGPSRDEDAHERTGELYAIYVLAEHQDVGVGRELMHVATSWLADRFDAATLWVLDSNARTRRFYERLGWSADGATKEEERGSFILREARYRNDLGEARPRRR